MSIHRLVRSLGTALAICLVAVAAARAQDRAILDLRIGAADGPTTHQFNRIGGVHVFPSGEIAVLDNGTPEVRVFSDRGAFLRRFARDGDGPGELRAPGWLTAGRTTVAVTRQNARATIFSGTGAIVQTLLLTAPQQSRWTLVRETSAGWYAQQRIPPRGTRRAGQVYQDSFAIFPVDARSGQLGRRVIAFGGQRSVADPAMSSPPLFDGRPSAGVDAMGRVYLTDASVYEVRVYGPDGRLIRTMRPAHQRRAVTDRDIDRYAMRVRDYFNTRTFRDADAQMQRLIDARRAAWHPEYHAATGGMLVAPNGALWIERTDVGDDPSAAEMRRILPQAASDMDARLASH